MSGDYLLRLISCGAPDGVLVIYFHGAPGAPEECLLFDAQGREDGLSVISLDRFSAPEGYQGEGYFRLLATEILACAGTAQIHLVGFSIGAFTALQTCRHLQGRVASVSLISAGAPLEAGDFLPGMAGRQVFQLAKQWPVLFRLLSGWQALLAKFAPGLLFNMLFASAKAADAELRQQGEFCSTTTTHLRSCFDGRVAGYARDVLSYVAPWAGSLGLVKAKVRIWHGADDNWSPKAMAEYLGQALPACERVEIMPGLSHYSCLQQAVPPVCAAIRADTEV